MIQLCKRYLYGKDFRKNVDNSGLRKRRKISEGNFLCKLNFFVHFLLQDPQTHFSRNTFPLTSMK